MNVPALLILSYTRRAGDVRFREPNTGELESGGEGGRGRMQIEAVPDKYETYPVLLFACLLLRPAGSL